MEGKVNLYSTFKTWCRKSLELTNLIGVFYEATKGLEIIINKGDYDALVAVLEAMFLVRSNQPEYDKLF